MSFLIIYLIMHPDRVGRIINNNYFRYGIRILILYIFSAAFKSFDPSFPHEPGLFTLRGQAFSALYVLFGLGMWEGALRLSALIERDLSRKHPAMLIPGLALFFLLYGLLTAWCFGFFYGCFDLLFFQSREAWNSFRTISYELNIGTFIFYLLLVGYNGTIYYYQHWQRTRQKTEAGIRQRLKAAYDTMKGRLNPDFFTRSLTVLSNLAEKSPESAAEYSRHLASLYRFLNDKKFEQLIPLSQELDQLESYRYLLNIRHRNSLFLDIAISKQVRQFSRIPPAALHLLIENALRRNLFSVNRPLHIRIYDRSDQLLIEHRLQKEVDADHHLEQLQKSYQLAGGTGLSTTENKGVFMARLPLL